ncbi:hypothetical protein CC86DRAFT_368201 [Ophiobolus disseminans]|uniref:Clr5 domain-containing protein n=1 Tax=Ophiobolus disseminans TaxID=1469910 RepID=A0A6A7A939_9PLEO|nr:hypothetical protein CC86DRAFT_368201 [Ophiobolus disseminans]
MQPPAKTRKRKAPTLRESDWEPYKDQINELYTSGMPLKQVKEFIEAEHSFHAEIRQYRLRLSQWKLDKNIKPEEMRCIVKKRQKRRLLEVDKPGLVFQVRGNEVDQTKIDRWMNSHDIPDSMLYAPSPAASTPSALGCRTISEIGSPTLGDPQTPHIRASSIASSLLSTREAFSTVWLGWLDLILSPWSSPTLHEDFALCKHSTNEYLRVYGHEGVTATGDNLLADLWTLPTYRDEDDVWTSLLESTIQYWLGIGLSLESRCNPWNRGLMPLVQFGTMTPLLLACRDTSDGSLDYLSLLLKFGANVHALDSLSRGGALHVVLIPLLWTRLRDQARKCAENKLVMLLEAGCDPNTKDFFTGQSPSRYANKSEKVWAIWINALRKTKGRRVALARDFNLGLREAQL